MLLHANLDVTYRGNTYLIKPELLFDQISMSRHSIPAALPGAPNAIVSINDVQLPAQATLSTTNLPDPEEIVQVDLSTKPMIWLVWAGTFLYTLGGLLAYRRRVIEYGKEEDVVVVPTATGDGLRSGEVILHGAAGGLSPS
jgi:hypothetical protein